MVKWVQLYSSNRSVFGLAVLNRFLCNCHRNKQASDFIFPFIRSNSTTAASAASLWKMRDRVPIQISEIPLSGFTLGKTIKITVEKASALSSMKGDLLVVGVQPPPSEGEQNVKDDQSGKKSEPLADFPENVDQFLAGELKRLVNRYEFTGAEGKTAFAFLPSQLPFEELGLLGCKCNPIQTNVLDGYDSIKKSKSPLQVTPFHGSKFGKPFAALLSTAKVKSVVLYVKASTFSPLSIQSLIESFLISSRADERFKSQPTDKPLLESLTILVDGVDDAGLEMFRSAADRAKVVASGIQLAKELTASPPNYCNPETLAKTAEQISKEHGLKCQILGEAECVKRKMGAYLAVNQGSLFEPQFIHLTYTPAKGEVKKRIAFIGKGVCMDTGGYNIKTGKGIENMKMDMGGAAAVLGCASIIGAAKPQHTEVHFIIAAAENMIDSRAYRPGDIVTAASGLTIEIGNTDAEGRLTLADALHYAETEVKPDAILDCATLTGAGIVGLGLKIGGCYSNDNEWMSTVLNAARRSGSPLWPMPLYSDYRKDFESKLADLVNCACVPTGGSLTAALFLKEFVKETPWAHIDMAGPVYDPKISEHTGYGTKILAEVVFGLE